VYHYVLENRETELVTLNEELSFAKSYMELHAIRHEGNLKVSISIDNTSGLVVPMSLQIILENALKHNEVSSHKPLIISIHRNGSLLTIENNLQPKKTIVTATGIGLNTIDRRYKHITQRGIDIYKDNSVFRVTIPIIPGFDENATYLSKQSESY
jgi:two-component system, LytTR family, sensor kinase